MAAPFTTPAAPQDARTFSAFAALLAAVETEQAIAEPSKTTVTAAAPSSRPAKRQRNSATSELSRSVGSDSEMGTHEFSDNSSSAADHEDEPWQALASLSQSQCASHSHPGGVCPYRHCACPGYDGCAHPDGAWCKSDQPAKRKLCSPCQDAQLVSVAPESPSHPIGTTAASKRSPRSQSIGRPSRCPNPKHANGCPEQHCKCGGYGSFCPHGAGECTSTQNVKWRKFCNACLSAKRRYTKATAAPVVMQARPQASLTPALPPMPMQPGAFQAMASGYRPVPYLMAMPTSFVYPMMPNFPQPVMHRVAMQ